MTPLSLFKAFIRVLVPTLAQCFGAVFISLAILILLQSSQLLSLLGISSAAVTATGQQFNQRFGAVLSSPITSKIVLVAFWAGIGLVIYLICWSAYNVLITARNEVTLETQYTNRSIWDGPWLALGMKIAAVVLLLAYITTFSYGISAWLALATPVFSEPSTGTVVSALIAVLGFALQLYILLVIVQLLFTPWYTNSPFTDQNE